ncbi:MAG TPA: histidine kinase dimerization/phospho-acceptor domain-containing protein, partial [Kiritimatiellia bacterium]|nr:histidine kinase dimerization/phospho-acceptor domain-containing protein [Kiritimatiellia bacterium]
MQKLDSVGRLAGGVAHDFNNLLMGIMGYTELCRDLVTDNPPALELLDAVLKEVKRSANLTRQLLAFARKQTVAPKVISLNDAVANMLTMLPRLIGEDIDVAWFPADELHPIKIDPSQIDQILANLCVNARDAINGTGRVTIETGRVVFDEAFCARHAE